MSTKPVVIRGFLGWCNPGANTLSSLDVYGPGGRWGGRDGHSIAAPEGVIPMGGLNGQGGDVLADALARAGMTEGTDLIIVAVPRRASIERPGIVGRIEAVIAEYLPAEGAS